MPLLSESDPVSIELHVRPLRRLRKGDSLLDSSFFWRDATLIKKDGVEFFMPTVEARLLHIFYHSQIADRYYKLKRIPVRSIMDFDRVMRSTKDVNWDIIFSRVAKSKLYKEFSLYVENCREYFFLSIPSVEAKRYSTVTFINKTIQEGLLRHKLFFKVHGTYKYISAVLEYIFSPSSVRRCYGNMPVLPLLGKHVADLLESKKYTNRIKYIQSLWQ